MVEDTIIHNRNLVVEHKNLTIEETVCVGGTERKKKEKEKEEN